jgi:DNA-binding NarL/FixJ family response regulator
VTTVVLADDQELVRAGLRVVLEAHGVAVLGEAGTGRTAVDEVRRASPDVVLLDVEMPGGGLVAAREIRALPRPPAVVMLTTFDLDEYVHEALRAGAVGFLLKTAPAVELVRGVHAAAAGELVVAPQVLTRMVERFTTGPAPERAAAVAAALTGREADVLRAMATGATNAEIARTLHLGEATVKTHVTAVLQKLGVRDRTHAVVVAFESGFVRPQSARGS